MSELEDDVLNGSDAEAESMTAAEVLKALEDALLNEKFSPELLEHKADIVECMMEQLQQMEENIQRARKTDFKVSLHRLEVDRIRYVLSSYLRTRLLKIQRYTAQILEAEAKADVPKLTPEELKFAKDYQENMEDHFKNVALRHMPPNVQTLASKEKIVHPALDHYVFLRVNEDVEGVLVEEETAEAREEVIDMESGDQHIMRYRPIAGLVASGAVTLI